MIKVNHTDEQVLKFISDNPGVSKQKVIETLHVGKPRMNRLWTKANHKKLPLKPLPKISIEEVVKSDREKKQLQEKAADAHKKSQYLLKELEAAEKRANIALGIQNNKGQHSIDITKIKAIDKTGEATAVVVASDWHVEERVDKRLVNGLNEYNPEIARERAATFFQNALRIVETQRQSIPINTLVLALLGDFINGYIHEEFIEDNFMSPTEAILFAQDLLTSGIDFFVREGNFTKIIIPTCFGNHGRTTLKSRVATGYKNSFEWLMYQNLGQHYKDSKIVEFKNSDSYFNYVDIYGVVIRFHHGDNVSYGGGVGGVTIPLMKYISRSNSQLKADYDVIGHYHQYSPSSKCLINGSNIGYNPYAIKIGAEYEKPRQAYFQVDSKRGITIHAPIIVE